MTVSDAGELRAVPSSSALGPAVPPPHEVIRNPHSESDSRPDEEDVSQHVNYGDVSETHGDPPDSRLDYGFGSCRAYL
jgi:hypothetical protein